MPTPWEAPASHTRSLRRRRCHQHQRHHHRRRRRRRLPPCMARLAPLLHRRAQAHSQRWDLPPVCFCRHHTFLYTLQHRDMLRICLPPLLRIPRPSQLLALRLPPPQLWWHRGRSHLQPPSNAGSRSELLMQIVEPSRMLRARVSRQSLAATTLAETLAGPPPSVASQPING